MTEPNHVHDLNLELISPPRPDRGWIALSEVLAPVLAKLEREAAQESAGG